MKILVDTNVLVSAVLRDKDPETIILWIISQDDFDWIVSPRIITEYKAVLSRRKFSLPPELLNRWYAILDDVTILVDIEPMIDFPRDIKDSDFISCALAVQADYLITGDKDFTEAQRILTTTILSVSQFKRLIIDITRK